MEHIAIPISVTATPWKSRTTSLLTNWSPRGTESRRESFSYTHRPTEDEVCPCHKAIIEWLVIYHPLHYAVCTDCLDTRLDWADVFPVFEPDEIRRYSVTRSSPDQRCNG